jgi:uncharacterized protein (TIGR02145 family)
MISFLPFYQNSSAIARMLRLSLFLLVVILTSCSKEFINPYDPATRADEWMPHDLNIDTVDLGILRISWTQDIKHIDGYFLRKTNNGWPTVIELPGEATSYIDTAINSLEGELRYSLRAKAGNRLSDSVLADEVINVPLQPGIRDIDGTFYNVVQIGDQTWMSENLRTSRYSNGDPIPNIVSSSEWAACTSGAWCTYENDAANEAIYGKLYNWYAVADSRNVCPTGWRVPSDLDWSILIDFLGGEVVAGGKMKSLIHWSLPNSEATNESAFEGFPSGYRYSFNGFYNSIGYSGYWWSSTEATYLYTWYLNINYDNGNADRNFTSKNNGFSVRCLKD